MNSQLLLYCWGSVCEPIFERELESLNIPFIKFSRKMNDYHADSEFAMEFIQTIHKNKISVVFSYDYFPLISTVCEINHIPYASWLYDCPQYTTFSKTIGNEYNYLFCFDAHMTSSLLALGAKHCFHLPLGVPKRDISLLTDEKTHIKKSDISFVGNLYNDEKNRVRYTKFSLYTQGFLEGIIESQYRIYGYNFIKESLTDRVVDEIAGRCNLSLGREYFFDKRQLVSDAIGMEISARERERVVKSLGRYFQLDLYTGSKIENIFFANVVASGTEQMNDLLSSNNETHISGVTALETLTLKKRKKMTGNLQILNPVNYEKEMPLVFKNSKINLNITSKTIESGNPLRVLDILSCGGFCITNYQPEIAEYFEDGVELVMYSSMDDLIDKVEYYLQHEEERVYIAQNGLRKVQKDFSLRDRIREMLEKCR